MVKQNIITILICAFLTIVPGIAEAGNFVVLQFQGRGPASSARLSLVRALLDEDSITLMPQRDYVAFARSVGVSGNAVRTGAGVRNAASSAGVDGVFVGRTVWINDRWHVRLSFFDAEGNRRVHRNYRIVRGSFTQNDLRRIVNFTKSRAELASEDEPAAVSTRERDPGIPEIDDEDIFYTPPVPSPEPDISSSHTERASYTGTRPAGTAGQQEEKSTMGDTGWARDSSDAGFQSGGDRGPDTRHANGHLRFEGDYGPAATIFLIGGGVNRSYEMQCENTTITYGTFGSSSGLGIALIPELGLHFRGFPFADFGEMLEGIGIDASFSRSFVVSEFVVREGMTQTGSSEISTPMWRFHIDGKWMHDFFRGSPYAPKLGFLAGMGYSGFSVAGQDTPFTSVRHVSFRLGAEAVFSPLRILQVEGNLIALPLALPGNIEKAAFGQKARAAGWIAGAGLSGKIAPDLSGPRWFFRLERQSIGSKFEGTGVREDGGKSIEVYFSLRLGLGWAF